MARYRTIKPEFFEDEKLARVSRDSRLLYVGLWIVSDDYGVCKADPIWLKSRVFGYDDVDRKTFLSWLQELEFLGRIIPFDHNGESFYFMPKFKEHQYIDKPSKWRNPTPPEGLAQQSRVLREDSPTIPEVVEPDIEVELDIESELEPLRESLPKRKRAEYRLPSVVFEEWAETEKGDAYMQALCQDPRFGKNYVESEFGKAIEWVQTKEKSEYASDRKQAKKSDWGKFMYNWLVRNL